TAAVALGNRLLGSGELTGNQLVSISRELGTAYVALGQQALAVDAFRAALARQPDFSMDSRDTSPTVLEALERARQARPAPRRERPDSDEGAELLAADEARRRRAPGQVAGRVEREVAERQEARRRRRRGPLRAEGPRTPPHQREDGEREREPIELHRVHRCGDLCAGALHLAQQLVRVGGGAEAASGQLPAREGAELGQPAGRALGQQAPEGAAVQVVAEGVRAVGDGQGRGEGLPQGGAGGGARPAGDERETAERAGQGEGPRQGEAA